MKNHAFVLTILGVLIALNAESGSGVTEDSIATTLAGLPEVSQHLIDESGHLVSLRGVLSTDGSIAPTTAALAFLASYPVFYPSAPGTTFNVQLSSRDDDGSSSVVIEQVVGGFPVRDTWVRFEFGQDGVLIGVDGVVLHDGDVSQARGVPMDQAQAMTAIMKHIETSGEILSISPWKELDVQTGVRAWGGRAVAVEDDDLVSYLVMVDAVAGELIGEVTSATVTLFVDPLQYDSSLKRTSELLGPAGPINGCVPVEPPPGSLWNLQGFSEWPDGYAAMDTWSYDEVHGLGSYISNDDRYYCPSDPADDLCNHGAIIKAFEPDDLPAGYDRVRLYLDPKGSPTAGPPTLTLRWGDGVSDGARVITALPFDGVLRQVDLDLSEEATWRSEDTTWVKLEVDSSGVDGALPRLDLLPGGWLRFPAPPDSVTGNGGPITQGRWFWIDQEVVNFGCEMAHGSYPGMRETSWEFQRLDSSGSWVQAPFTYIPHVSPPGGHSGRFDPAYDPNGGSQQVWHDGLFRLSESPGWYRVRTVFANQLEHPEDPSPWGTFYVNVPPPDLSIRTDEPVELYRVEAHPALRQNLLVIDGADVAGYGIRLPAEQTVDLAEPVNATVRVLVRRHQADGDQGCDAGFATAGVVTELLYPGDSDATIDVPVDATMISVIQDLMGNSTLDVFDVEVSIDPVVGEPNTENNTVCLPAWLVVVASPPRPGDDGTRCLDVTDPETCFRAMFEFDYSDPLSQTGATFASWEMFAEHRQGADQFYLETRSTGGSPWFEFEALSNSNDERLAGAMIRYRRVNVGIGTGPSLAAGAIECSEGNMSNCQQWHDMSPLAPHTYQLEQTNQWHTVMWKRGSKGPFGGLGVLSLAERYEPTGDDDPDSVHHRRLVVVPDANVCGGEPGCSGSPVTLIGFIATWYKETTVEPSTPDVVFTGLKVQASDGTWIPMPYSQDVGSTVVFGAEFTNTSPSIHNGVALVASLDVIDQSRGTTSAGASLIHSFLAGESFVLEITSHSFPLEGSYGVLVDAYADGERVGDARYSLHIANPPDLDATLVFRDGMGDWWPFPDSVAQGSSWPVGVAITNTSQSPFTGTVSATLSIQPVGTYGSPAKSSHFGSVDIGSGSPPYADPLGQGDAAYILLPPDWIAEFGAEYAIEGAVSQGSELLETLDGTVVSCSVPAVDLP